MQSTDLCVIDDCGATAFSRRLCRPHYMRAHKAAELDRYPKVRTRKPTKSPEPRPEARHGGRARYANGCRCDTCRTEANRRKREQYARRKAAGLYLTGSVESQCQTCGLMFTFKRPRVYCSNACYREAQGLTPIHDWWIHKGWRYAIYERDGWRCQICGEPVDMCAPKSDAKAPSLDHIVPRAHGGGDEPENLRLAHRWCNSSRGAIVDAA